MNHNGTHRNDVLDQAALGLPEFSNLDGGPGDDTITVGVGTAIGGEGNDVLIGTSKDSAAAYWNSPTGIVANLQTGVVEDGFGTRDQLQNMRILHGSSQGDRIVGSNADDTVWDLGGNNVIDGGAGFDTVRYYGVELDSIRVSYDFDAEAMTVQRTHTGGEISTDVLNNVENVVFISEDGSTFAKRIEDVVGPFSRQTTIALGASSGNSADAQQLLSGDFNGDGHIDIWVNRADWASVGETPVQVQILLGDGKGGFDDRTADLFGGLVPSIHWAPRIIAADFNSDGASDVYAPDFGKDAPPFPGGQDRLFLSSNGRMVDASHTLEQRLSQAHGVSVGDLNGDGHQDVLVNVLNDPDGRADQVLFGDGQGELSAHWQLFPNTVQQDGRFAAGHTWSYIGDLNADGMADMVLGTWDGSGGPSRVLLNQGNTLFTEASIRELPRSGIDREIVLAIETMDLNGDALPDLVMSLTNGGSFEEFYQVPYLQFLINEGNGSFRDETAQRLPQDVNLRIGSWYKFLDVVDVNGDDHDDILAVSDSYGHGASLYLNDGDGSFSHVRDFSLGGGSFHAMDVDADGIPEIVGSSGSGLTVWWNDLFPTQGGRHYTGGLSADRITGSDGNDYITGNGGNDYLDGGAGTDVACYEGVASQYQVARTADGFVVTALVGSEGVDQLVGIERLQFSDGLLALDIDLGEIAGSAYRLYQAAFDRTPDNDGLKYWIEQMDAGLSIRDASHGFVSSAEFHQLYGLDSAPDVVIDAYYRNTLDREADSAGKAYWVNELNAGRSASEILIGFSESVENQARVLGQIEEGIWLIG